MLKREQDAIIQMVWTAWNRFQQEDSRKLVADRETAVNAFKSDIRVKNLVVSLEQAGINRPDAFAWNLMINSSGSYGLGLSHGPTGVHADIQKTMTTINATVKKRPQWHDSLACGELNIAISSAKSKWADIQSPVYTLAADLSAAKDEAGIEAAIRTFTKSIT